MTHKLLAQLQRAPDGSREPSPERARALPWHSFNSVPTRTRLRLPRRSARARSPTWSRTVSPAVVNIIGHARVGAQPTPARRDSARAQGRGRGDQQEQLRGILRPLLRRAGHAAAAARAQSRGAGLRASSIDANGYIVTNNHVIESADKIVVTPDDGRKLDCDARGQRSEDGPRGDQGDRPASRTSRSATPTASRVGDWVLAIGNPSVWAARRRRASSPRAAATFSRVRTTTICRSTRRSTSATRAARCSTSSG